jgi:hypothetical protein
MQDVQGHHRADARSWIAAVDRALRRGGCMVAPVEGYWVRR